MDERSIPNGDRFKTCERGSSRGQHARLQKANDHKQVYRIVCNICTKKDCHSSKHLRRGKEVYKRFSCACLTSKDVSSSDEDSENPDDETNEQAEVDADSYRALT